VNSPFAQIVATPLAGIQNHRQVLILSSNNSNLSAEEIQRLLIAEPKDGANKKDKPLRGRDAKP
jgi:hypothetical protein